MPYKKYKGWVVFRINNKYTDRCSFAAAVNLSKKFESLLCREGIEIKAGGVLEDLILSTAEVDYVYRKLMPADPTRDLRILFQELTGIVDIVKKVLSVEGHRDFNVLLKHLIKLNDSNPIQTKQADYLDRDSNKLFELYIACLAMRMGQDVVLDDPDDSSGDNPDVLVTLEGVRWGFACKVIYTDNIKTFFENITRGLDQIDRSSADKGIVIISLKNILDREKYWPRNEKDCDIFAFTSYETAKHMLENEVDAIKIKLFNHVGKRDLLDTFKNHKSASGFCLHGMITTAIVKELQPVPCSISRMMIVNVEGLTEKETEVLAQLNNYAQWDPREY